MLISSSQSPDVHLLLRGRWKAFRRWVNCIAVPDYLNHETARQKDRVFVSPAKLLDVLRRRWSGLRALPKWAYPKVCV